MDCRSRDVTLAYGNVANSKGAKKTHPWERLRTEIQEAAMQLCLEELQGAWEELERERQADIDSEDESNPEEMLMPSRAFAPLQERWYVQHKLYSAVSCESLRDMKLALDLARGIGIDENSVALLLTFCDVLARQEQTVGFSTDDIAQALERADWPHALELVIEIALACGADRSLLLNGLARLCTDSSSSSAGLAAPRLRGQGVVGAAHSLAPTREARGTAAATGTSREAELNTPFRGRAMEAVYVAPTEQENVRGRLLSLLYTEAVQHAQNEVTKAWEALENMYRSGDSAAGTKKGFGPGHQAFSRQEELFFIRNQINNAVHQESLPSLRRAITLAISSGMDPKSIEIEISYRDALTRHHYGAGLYASYVLDSVNNGDWWSALDDIVAACFVGGADRKLLFQMIAKVCTYTSQTSPHVSASIDKPPETLPVVSHRHAPLTKDNLRRNDSMTSSSI